MPITSRASIEIGTAVVTLLARPPEYTGKVVLPRRSTPSRSHGVGSGVLEKDREGVREGVNEGVTLVEGVVDGVMDGEVLVDGVVLREGVVDDVGEDDRVIVTVGVLDTVGVTLGVVLLVGDDVGLRDGVREGVIDSEALGDTDGVMERDTLDEGVALGVMLGSGTPHTITLLSSLPAADMSRCPSLPHVSAKMSPLGWPGSVVVGVLVQVEGSAVPLPYPKMRIVDTGLAIAAAR